MLKEYSVNCPYCGETFDTLLDLSAGDQQYTEDCQICCRPIEFRISVDMQGELLDVEIRREDE